MPQKSIPLSSDAFTVSPKICLSTRGFKTGSPAGLTGAAEHEAGIDKSRGLKWYVPILAPERLSHCASPVQTRTALRNRPFCAANAVPAHVPCLYGVNSGLLRLLSTMCVRPEVDATCHEQASAQQRKRRGDGMEEFDSAEVGLK